MVTSGPGLTNALTPLADAFFDSTPVMLISGQIGTKDLNKRKEVRQRGFQEVAKSAIQVEKALTDINVILNASEKNLSNSDISKRPSS